MKYRIIAICLITMCLFTGAVYPDKAPHVHITNAGEEYDIYFAGTNYRDAFVYQSPYLINTYSSNITGYVEISGTTRNATFPVYDFGYIRTNDSYPATYIYLNDITECDFIGFTETAWWKHDINTYLLLIACIFSFFGFLRR